MLCIIQKEKGWISMFQYVIVGAGYAGSIIAERIATELNAKVLVIEQRSHIGGNAYDRFDEQGVLVHEYGPHIFHTSSKEVWDYLSRFTEWHHYEHLVLASIDGKEVPLPFNLNAIDLLFPHYVAQRLEEKLVSKMGYNVKVPILKLRQSDDEDLRFLAEYVYEKVFLGYTLKQWGIRPEELDPTVTGRVPVYISRDNRYFQDPYQGLPKRGYTEMFKRMLKHPNIKLMMNTSYQEVLTIDEETKKVQLFNQPFEGQLIYTGKIDEFFNYQYGDLPYRSLRFEFETYQQENYQSVGQKNYPNNYDFTRITEFKHLTGQKSGATTIAREYPIAYEKGENIPYYSIISEENLDKYKKYKRLAEHFLNVHFVGRLAEYRYYDMDAVVATALKTYRKLSKSVGEELT